MSQKDIRLALKDLINNSGNKINYSMPGFNLIDVFPIFKQYFNEKALKTMENKTQHLVYQYNEPTKAAHILIMLGKLNLRSCAPYKDESYLYTRKADLVRFIASRSSKDRLPDAISKVIKTINHLADKDFTKASMVELGVLEIQPIDKKESEYAVISYITLTDAGHEYAKNNMPAMFVEEGCLPTEVDAQ